MEIIIAIISAVFGAAAMFIALRTRFKEQSKNHAALETREKELLKELTVVNAQLQQDQEKLSLTRENLATAEATRLAFEKQNSELKEQAYKDYNILRALAPVQEQLKSVREKVASMEAERTKQFGEITEQLRNAQQTDMLLLTTTRSLESTMRNTKERGRWGELQLQRAVEAAGMIEHIDYEEQATLSDGQRPDMIINLPGNKFIIIDAKVPLSAYYQSAQEENNTGEPVNYGEHAKALRHHIKNLSDKKYWEKQNNSPELVICFLPAESLFVNAIEADSSLLDYAFSHHVALASPITLVATLKAIAFAWKQSVVTNEAKKLFFLAEALHKNLSTLGSSVQGLGKNLNSTINGYNKLIQNLNGQLVTNLRKMKNFDPSSLEVSPLEDVEIKQLSKPEYAQDPVLDSIPENLM